MLMMVWDYIVMPIQWIDICNVFFSFDKNCFVFLFFENERSHNDHQETVDPNVNKCYFDNSMFGHFIWNKDGFRTVTYRVILRLLVF